MENKQEKLYRLEVHAQARIFNIKGTSKDDARMRLIDNEDISIDDEVSEGVLIE